MFSCSTVSIRLLFVSPIPLVLTRLGAWATRPSRYIRSPVSSSLNFMCLVVRHSD
ncbi:hypothetical protein LINPERHAP2_LOCUS24718 [Linum perenne]